MLTILVREGSEGIQTSEMTLLINLRVALLQVVVAYSFNTYYTVQDKGRSACSSENITVLCHFRDAILRRKAIVKPSIERFTITDVDHFNLKNFKCLASVKHYQF